MKGKLKSQCSQTESKTSRATTSDCSSSSLKQQYGKVLFVHKTTSQISFQHHHSDSKKDKFKFVLSTTQENMIFLQEQSYMGSNSSGQLEHTFTRTLFPPCWKDTVAFSFQGLFPPRLITVRRFLLSILFP